MTNTNTSNTHIPPSFIEDLLSRIDITEVVGSRVSLRRAGNNWIAKCPFHQEKTPSFTVSPTKQFYHCFGCGASGDAIRFLTEYEGLHFVEAIETLAAKAGLSIPSNKKDKDSDKNPAATKTYAAIYKILDQAAKFYREQLRKAPTAKKAQDYLKSRGITGETAKLFGLGYATAAWDGLIKRLGVDAEQCKTLLAAGLIIQKSQNLKDDRKEKSASENLSGKFSGEFSGNLSGNFSEKPSRERAYDRFRERIIFPIRDRRGRVVGFGGRIIGKEGEPKYLNSPETAVYHKGSELYGLYEARTLNRNLPNIIVVEGYLDVICLAQNGIKNAVAALGTALTEQHIKILFTQCSDIIFCFDGDKAGIEAARRILPLLMPQIKEGRRVKFMLLPEGEDPDSCIRKEGTVAFLDRMNRASHLSEYLFDSFAAGLDLEHLDNRARLVSLTKPLIALLPKGVFQQMMYNRLAELTGVESNPDGGGRRPAGMAKIAGKINSKNSYLKKSLKSLPPSIAQRAATMLLKNRDLIDLIPDNKEFNEFCGSDAPDIFLLCAIIKILQGDRNITAKKLVEKLTEEGVGQPCLELLKGITQSVTQEMVNDEGIKQEFLGSLQRLREQMKEQVMESLLLKAKTIALTAEEKIQLRNLLDQKEQEKKRKREEREESE